VIEEEALARVKAQQDEYFKLTSSMVERNASEATDSEEIMKKAPTSSFEVLFRKINFTTQWVAGFKLRHAFSLCRRTIVKTSTPEELAEATEKHKTSLSKYVQKNPSTLHQLLFNFEQVRLPLVNDTSQRRI